MMVQTLKPQMLQDFSNRSSHVWVSFIMEEQHRTGRRHLMAAHKRFSVTLYTAALNVASLSKKSTTKTPLRSQNTVAITLSKGDTTLNFLVRREPFHACTFRFLSDVEPVSSRRHSLPGRLCRVWLIGAGMTGHMPSFFYFCGRRKGLTRSIVNTVYEILTT